MHRGVTGSSWSKSAALPVPRKLDFTTFTLTPASTLPLWVEICFLERGLFVLASCKIPPLICPRSDSPRSTDCSPNGRVFAGQTFLNCWQNTIRRPTGKLELWKRDILGCVTVINSTYSSFH